MNTVLAALACLSLLVVGADQTERPATYEILIQATESGVSLQSVSGCTWTGLEFSSSQPPHRAVVTDHGVRVASEAPDPSQLAEEQASFALFIQASESGFQTEALRGGVWTDRLTFDAAPGYTCEAVLTDRGVRGAAKRIPSN